MVEAPEPMGCFCLFSWLVGWLVRGCLLLFGVLFVLLICLFFYSWEGHGGAISSILTATLRLLHFRLGPLTQTFDFILVTVHSHTRTYKVRTSVSHCSILHLSHSLLVLLRRTCYCLL